MEIESSCIFCGCGCRLRYVVENDKILRVLPSKDDPVSRGKPCVKGLSIHEICDENRVKTPLVRDKLSKDFEPVDWEYAYELVKEEILKRAPEDLMFVSSGEITNEDNFVIQKFARIVCQTNNIDNCARLCHAPTVYAYQKMLGISANPSTMDDVFDLDLLLLAGTHPFVTYPVMFSRIVEAKKNGLKIIYLHHLDHEISKFSDLTLIAYPGTELAIMLSWIKYLIDHGLGKDLDGIEALKSSVEGYSFKLASKISGVEEDKIKEAAEMILESESFGFMHGMGLTQQLEGTENIEALISLALLKNGKILSLRGKINVQGAGDVLAHPWVSPAKLEELEKLWEHPIPKWRGKTLIEAVFTDPVEFMWISSMNPAVSMPNLTRVHETFRKMFVVVSHYVMNYTAENFARVVFPTPLLIEREGTITNGERRVRYVKKVRNGYGKPEWLILKELSKYFGKDKWFNYSSPKEIFSEITRAVGAYKSLNPEEIYSGKDGFADKTIKFKSLCYIDVEGFSWERNTKYPFILTSERLRSHFVSGDLTRLSKTLCKMKSEPELIMNPRDAERLGIKDGDLVKVISEVGEEVVKVKLSSRVREGILASSYHFSKFLFNKLTPAEFDYETMIPNYKAIPVRIEKLSPHAPS